MISHCSQDQQSPTSTCQFTNGSLEEVQDSDQWGEGLGRQGAGKVVWGVDSLAEEEILPGGAGGAATGGLGVDLA